MARKKKEVTEEVMMEGEKTEVSAAEPSAQEKAPAEEAASAEGRMTRRDAKEYHDLMNRLKRIEGQVRGIQGMLERDCYCTDIMVQVAAVNAALGGFNRALLSSHMRNCVAEDIRQGKDETIEELVAILGKLMR